MALTATIYTFETELADVDRGVYESFSLRLARQPSETLEYMVVRFLAYCLEYADRIELTEGVASGEQPAILVRDLTGRVTAWIEVGMPSAERVHRGSKHADRVAVYTHRNVASVLAELDGKRIHRAADIAVHDFGRGFVPSVAAVLERRNRVSLSVTERLIYLNVNGRAFETAVTAHRLR
jgi:uncharacterized protein YaeQ